MEADFRALEIPEKGKGSGRWTVVSGQRKADTERTTRRTEFTEYTEEKKGQGSGRWTVVSGQRKTDTKRKIL